MPDRFTQAVQLSGKCSMCGEPAEVWGAQVIEDNRLGWELDWDCEACQALACDRGLGPAPERIRTALIAQHGTHCLKLTDPSVQGGRVLKVFRGALGFSLREAQEAANALRRDGYEATFVEVRLLADLLRQQGMTNHVDPA